MKRTIKFILILCAVVVVMLATALCVGFGCINDDAQKTMAKTSAAIKAAKAQGQKRGSLLDEASCLEEALARHKADSDTTRQKADGDIAVLKTFVAPFELRACLQSSRPLENFCKDVPPDEYTKVKPYEWEDQACSKRGVSDQHCHYLLKAVVLYCASPARTDKLAHQVPQPPSKK